MTCPFPDRQRLTLPGLALLAFACMVATDAATAADTAAETERAGRQQFVQCRACHTLEANKAQRVGPTLAGLFGARAGTRPGYSSSKALRALDVTWDRESLDAFLANTETFAPGNRMAFTGVRNADKRAALIRYLSTATAPSQSQ